MPTKRIIIADDALDFGRMLQASLTTLGSHLKVTLVPSAEEALLETRRGATDLLISDVRLPGMSGFELVRKARVHYPGLKIIVITGLKDDTMRQQAEAAGADAFFTKPLTIAEFLQTAQGLLDLPAGQPASAAAAAPAARLPDGAAQSLESLRARLGAKTVALLDENAKAAALSGVPLDVDLQPVLEAARVMDKVARLLSRAGGVLAFDGPGYDLLLAPVAGMTLVCVLENSPGKLRLALAVEEMLAAQKTLPAAVAAPKMVETPAPAPSSQPAVAETPPSQPEAPVVAAPALPALEDIEEDLGGLEGLFEHTAAPLPNLDLDSFWEQAAASTSSSAAPGALSFEDAQRLGLDLSE
mgnify:CR=1 FL=1